jgi:hypothetical protein
VKELNCRARTIKKSTLLLLQEAIDIDSRLLEDSAKGALWHIAGVVGNCGVTVQRRVEPDLMGARGLTVELQPEFL